MDCCVARLTAESLAKLSSSSTPVTAVEEPMLIDGIVNNRTPMMMRAMKLASTRIRESI